MKSELAADQKRTHGGSDTALHIVWQAMRQRCENPKNKRFGRYGGRGIVVCERWQDFALFKADSTDYAPGLTLDRKDNDGPYSPENCRWVTNKVNCRNTPKALRVEYQGVEVPLNELAERHGLRPATVYRRFRLRGESLEVALRPVEHEGKKR